ncbi:MAG: nucleotidyltransferase family protein [Albidovulum sp.]|uniref:nucleotidyltransferase family protein n=1 Tax=Albidovulum sp. TaxID=1872424 RepID=UPI003C827AB7
MVDIAIVIPAAGASSRMGGRDKLLMEVGGEPILKRSVAMARTTGARVIVTLPGSGPMLPARRTALTGTGIRPVKIPDYHDGMSASLRAGVREAHQADGLMILLPDMPDITSDDLCAVITAFAEDPGRPVRAVGDFGRPGHPVIFPRRLFQEISVLTGDIGAQRVLDGENIRHVPLPSGHATTDLDTPEDWANWKRQQQR